MLLAYPAPASCPTPTPTPTPHPTQNTANVWRKRAYRELLRVGEADLRAAAAAGGRAPAHARFLAAWAEATDRSRIPPTASMIA